MKARRRKSEKPAVASITKRAEGSAPSDVPPCEVPRVLTFEAVAKGEIPPLGSSGLPSSLEVDIPPASRWWLAKSLDDARAIRDALVESLFATPANFAIVKSATGESLRRVETVERYVVRKYDPAPVVVPQRLTALEKAMTFLAHETERELVAFDAKVTSTFGIDAVVERVSKLNAEWLIEANEDATTREALQKFHPVRIVTRPGTIFASSVGFCESELLEGAVSARTESILAKAFATGRKIPVIKTAEERIVFGVVLEPDEVDAQGDTISEGEIERACHHFMEEHGILGLQHKSVINGKVKLLECFIAPIAFEVEGQKVKKGTWLMKERVVDDDLWRAVKRGEFTGFSIGGFGARKPIN